MEDSSIKYCSCNQHDSIVILPDSSRYCMLCGHKTRLSPSDSTTEKDISKDVQSDDDNDDVVIVKEEKRRKRRNKQLQSKENQSSETVCDVSTSKKRLVDNKKPSVTKSSVADSNKSKVSKANVTRASVAESKKSKVTKTNVQESNKPQVTRGSAAESKKSKVTKTNVQESTIPQVTRASVADSSKSKVTMASALESNKPPITKPSAVGTSLLKVRFPAMKSFKQKPKVVVDTDDLTVITPNKDGGLSVSKSRKINTNAVTVPGNRTQITPVVTALGNSVQSPITITVSGNSVQNSSTMENMKNKVPTPSVFLQSSPFTTMNTDQIVRPPQFTTPQGSENNLQSVLNRNTLSIGGVGIATNLQALPIALSPAGNRVQAVMGNTVQALPKGVTFTGSNVQVLPIGMAMTGNIHGKKQPQMTKRTEEAVRKSKRKKKATTRFNDCVTLNLSTESSNEDSSDNDDDEDEDDRSQSDTDTANDSEPETDDICNVCMNYEPPVEFEQGFDLESYELKWIDCDGCHRWFHWFCVGIFDPTDTKFFKCKPCRSKQV